MSDLFGSFGSDAFLIPESVVASETPTPAVEGNTKSPATARRNTMPDAESVSDDELEPNELVGKYLELQTLLFKRQPDLMHIEPRKLRNNKPKNLQKSNPAQDPDAISQTILRRIRKLQSDLLFDTEEAHEKWTELRLALLKDAAERKKYYIDEDHDVQNSKINDSSSQTPDSNASSDDEDDSMKIGEFFSSLPEIKIDESTGISSTVASNTDEKSTIIIRSFDKWSGVSPRKTFQDACRAR